uniref:Uncharacterized protein n=1 Tax=Arundo donax TaxID=35708 RepID=A0A0A9CDS1_ARUDO
MTGSKQKPKKSLATYHCVSKELIQQVHG